LKADSTVMRDERVSVQLASDVPVDDTLLATLNQFHFKSLKLQKKAVSPHVLKYMNKVDQNDHSSTYMLRGMEAAGKANVQRLLKKDYLGMIGRHFNIYLKQSGRIRLGKAMNKDQLEPAVDILADEFEEDMVRHFGLTSFSPSRKFAVAITHDVDYVGNYPIANLKSGLVFLVNSLRTVMRPRLSMFYLKAAFRFLFGQVNYYGFDDILKIAKQNDFRPVFFLFAKLPQGNKLGPLQRLRFLNLNYSLENHDLSRAMKAITEANAEIGLHGSYMSADDPDLLTAEKEYLEHKTGHACQSIRQHYLNIYGRISHEIYSRIGIQVESTCGFISENGYLCSTTRPFYAVLPGHGQNQVIVLPMVFMDAVPLYFRPENTAEVFAQLRKTLHWLKQFNGFAAFNFHQRVISCFPEYKKLYEDIVSEIRDMGGKIATTTEIEKLYPPCTDV